MRPTGRPGHGAVVVLAVLALLVGLAMAPGMLGRVAATDIDHGWAASDTEWWILNEDEPNHNIPDFSVNDEFAVSKTVPARDDRDLIFSVGVVVNRYVTISGTKTLVFKVATGYVDTYGDWE
jgi:hypothetical protein